MSSAQVGKTELLLNIIGYFVDFDAAPMLLLQPTLEMAQAFSKDRLAPMVRDTPSLKSKISDSKARDSGNTILHKSFAGGHLTMAGANSPASLASRPIRILLADEVDRFPVSAGTEGDPFALAKKRTTTFWNRKILAVSTPTVKGISRIEALYEESTQERYHLDCPQCGHSQPLTWAQITFDRDDNGAPINVGHACEHCGAISGQREWMRNPGEWIAHAVHNTARGFHLNELISPWRTWPQIVADFLEAKKSPETLKTFVNTSLGETWEEEGDTVDHGVLYKRREHYPAPVPAGAVVLTASVDVQDDRLEVGVEGWGKNEENWKVDLRILRGDPARPDIWQKLDDYLGQRFEHESGAQLPIACAVLDSGGHYAQEVYKFVRPREVRRVYAIKGKSQAGAPIVGRPSKSNLGKVSLFSIGVDTAKEVIHARFKICEPGAGYVHFPVDPQFDEEYFAQLASEKRVTKYVKGRPRQEWQKTRARNEGLDLSVYNLAALYILNPNFDKLAERLAPAEKPERTRDDPSVDTTTKPKGRRKQRGRGGFVNSWR